MRKHCVVCGAEFEAKGNAKTCCKEHSLALLRQQDREQYARNPEKVLQRKREQRAQNPEKVRQRRRERYARNPENTRQRSREWYARNPEKVLQQKREQRAQNPEKVRQYKRDLYARNPERARQQSREWYARNPEMATQRASERYERRRRIEQNVYLVFKEIFGATPEIEAMSPRRRRLAAFAFCKSIGLLPSTKPKKGNDHDHP